MPKVHIVNDDYAPLEVETGQGVVFVKLYQRADSVSLRLVDKNGNWAESGFLITIDRRGLHRHPAVISHLLPLDNCGRVVIQ